MNTRIFVEKKPQFDTQSHALRRELNDALGLNITELRWLNIYDVFDISQRLLDNAIYSVFAEKVTDNVYSDVDINGYFTLCSEYLTGQFDIRANSATECLALLDSKTNATVTSGRLLMFKGILSTVEKESLEKYCINTIDSRIKDLTILRRDTDFAVAELKDMTGFNNLNADELQVLLQEMSLAMNCQDIAFIQDYFKNTEKRDPTEAEIKILDTYWSDHCRHTTFETMLTKVKFTKDKLGRQIELVFQDYLQLHNKLRKDKPVTLMDIATINARDKKARGLNSDVEVSDEINACSVYVDVIEDGKTVKYLLMFKNETHNHPTEIEPFGGASTCLGGAIRDPLSGRSYVFQAMRISGSADICQPVQDTMPNKLPQRTISTRAAAGFSAYGNQIGLATTYVKEIFHDGYKAKRLECGVVAGAVKAEYVQRLKPSAGDKVLLIGGKTGRDGIGGATGSSKQHNEKSLHTCFAQVQKGNAAEERKLQRLFSSKEFALIVKKSNDFGAGGVCVAVGELADGLIINLDAVPLKYLGLSGIEIAISESQERMAVVVEEKDVNTAMALCAAQNLDACVIATVTSDPRLIMTYKNKKIVDLNRAFIDTAGVRQAAEAEINIKQQKNYFTQKLNGDTAKQKLLNHLSLLNNTSMRGLKENFDSTIGSSTVFLPYGGKNQLTEFYASVQKLPTNKPSDICNVITYGFDPQLSSVSPFHGASYAVVDAIAKAVAVGASFRDIKFSMQEFFPKLSNPKLWGQPVAALLGAYNALRSFDLSAIGGKDSMSGTYGDINVPPTLIAFADVITKASQAISNDFKLKGSYIYLFMHKPDELGLPDYVQLKQIFDDIHSLIVNKTIISSQPVCMGGVARSIVNMCLGNSVGADINFEKIYDKLYGSIIVETSVPLNNDNAVLLGRTADKIVINGIKLKFDEAQNALEQKTANIYPIKVDTQYKYKKTVTNKVYQIPNAGFCGTPTALIPVFPGTNCEKDTAQAFLDAGATVNKPIFCNNTRDAINRSIDVLAKEIDNAHILVLAGGFSLGDEPDGSGKYIACILNNKKIKAAVNRLIDRRGLILGICNGFQALIKSGLLPYGRIGKININSPTLFRNDIGRHVSKIVNTRVMSNNSVWLQNMKVGTTHSIAISHGEGKFVCDEKTLNKLYRNGQVAFAYCDRESNATIDGQFNVNGSMGAIEGIVSTDGLILGKMAHSERCGKDIHKNLNEHNNQLQIFKNAVNYFKYQGEK